MSYKKHFLPSDKKRKRFIKAQVKTDSKYGKNPKDRSVKELIDNGIIFLDKPSGPTSHQVDSWIKEIINNEKVGHHGTLDPNATGVLPIGIGNATKSLQVMLPAGKEYVGFMLLHKDVDEKSIINVCKSFIGTITQLPPVRSAVKRVRRKRRIYYFDIIEIENRKVLFRVGCESGTYVRTLVVDIGKKLKTRAHLSELRRTRVGLIRENNTIILQDLKDAFIFYKEDKDEKYIRSIIHPVERILDNLPKIIVKDSTVDALCHGANLALPGVAEVDSDINKRDMVAVMTLKNEGVAVVKSLMSTDEIIQKKNGFCANLERVIMKQGTYPSIWKKP